MSALLNHNQRPVIQWKGMTFNQITSTVQKNTDASLNTSQSVRRLFKPLPLKIYRREIATHGSNSTPNVCNPRTSIRIDEINQPGGYLVLDKDNAPARQNGLVNTLDFTLPKNTTELGAPSCNTAEHCFSPAYNARRRVRSSGMINRKFNKDQQDVAAYYTNTQQYLTARNESYQRNLYHYQNNGETTPGTKCTLSSTFNPSNKRFMVQGAVSSGDFTTRRNYNTITNVGASFRTTYGKGMANAMAYGVPNAGGTNLKEKMGYPLTLSPQNPGACPKMRG
jgi:hypothetical protein